MKWLRIIGISTLILFGSAILLAQTIDRPAKPTAEAYKVVWRSTLAGNSPQQLTAGLNKFAGDGWELVEIDPRTNDDAMYIFQRQN